MVTDVRGKCIRRSAQNAKRNAKFLSSQAVIARSTARTVIPKERLTAAKRCLLWSLILIRLKARQDWCCRAFLINGMPRVTASYKRFEKLCLQWQHHLLCLGKRGLSEWKSFSGLAQDTCRFCYHTLRSQIFTRNCISTSPFSKTFFQMNAHLLPTIQSKRKKHLP